DIARDLLFSITDRVHWYVLTFDFRNGLQVDTAGVVRAVAQQNDGAHRQRCRLGEQVLQIGPDVRSRRGRLQVLDLRSALQAVAQAIKPHLKFLLEVLVQTGIKGLYRLLDS